MGPFPFGKIKTRISSVKQFYLLVLLVQRLIKNTTFNYIENYLSKKKSLQRILLMLLFYKESGIFNDTFRLNSNIKREVIILCYEIFLIINFFNCESQSKIIKIDEWFLLFFDTIRKYEM